MSDCDHTSINRTPAKVTLAMAMITISAIMKPLVAMRLQPKRKIVFISFSFVIVFMGINFVHAGFITDQIVPCGGSDQSDCTLCHLWNLVSNVINFISFNLAIPIATLLFVAAGIIFLTSAGSEDKVGLARKIFINTVIGLLIIFCSWLLVDTLLKTIATGAIYGAWNDFPVCTK